jgi:predicted lipid-binding transport protein (Tim44 family)
MSRIFTVVFFLVLLVAPAHVPLPAFGPEGAHIARDLAEARFGRGGSFGFRGSRGMFRSRSRSFRPRRNFGASRSRRLNRPIARRSFSRGGFGGFGGGFMGGLGGMLVGGMIGRMMFGGFGGSGGIGSGGMGSGGGIGLLEILLIGGGIFLLFRWLRNRQEPAYSGHQGYGAGYDDDSYDVADDRPSGDVYRGPDIGRGGHGRGSGPVAASYAAHSPAEEGLPDIQASDPLFSRENFLIDVREKFMHFQTCWANRDLSLVRDILDSDIYKQCQADLDALRSKGSVSKIENIEIRRLDLAESWQEEDYDFITVTYEVGMLDYVVSDTTGEVLEGSRTEPVRFTEHWTWARPSGANPWMLTAISQA